MNLHRPNKIADWLLIEADQRNFWQVLAAKSHGLVTPGNFISLIGLVLVFISLGLFLNNYMLAGALFLSLGRLCDVIDGWLADLTGTKSPLGEAVDATFDKIAIFSIIGLAFFVIEAIPGWLIGLVLAPNLLASLATIIAHFRRTKFHASAIGKLSSATQWIGLIGIITSSIWLSDLRIIFEIITTAGAIGSLIASLKYIKQSLAPKESKL